VGGGENTTDKSAYTCEQKSYKYENANRSPLNGDYTCIFYPLSVYFSLSTVNERKGKNINSHGWIGDEKCNAKKNIQD